MPLKKLLLEDAWVFNLDRTKIVTESISNNRTICKIPGTLSLCDTVNGNKRTYPKRVWEENLKEGSVLQSLIKNNAAFGLLEHPKDGIVDLTSPIAVRTCNAVLREDGIVYGEIHIFEDLPEGHKLKVLIDSGYNPMVSSRGYGSVVQRSDGIDEVQTDYICEGWDVVSRPSFSQAILIPTRETTPNESLSEKITQLKESGVANISNPTQQLKEEQPTMTIKEIRESLSLMKAVDFKSIGKSQLSEGFSRFSDLHRSVGEIYATDSKLAWECTKLHEDISNTENTWLNSLTAPKDAEIKKLSESVSKLAVLSENIVKVAKGYRVKATEAVATLKYKDTLLETIVQRGKKWNKIAEDGKRKNAISESRMTVAAKALDILAGKYKALENKYNVSTRALDLIAEKYHEDTTNLAKSLVEKQFGDKIEKLGVKESLVACKTANEVLRIKKTLSLGESNTPAKKEEVPTKKQEQTSQSAPKPALVESKPNTIVFEDPKPVTTSIDEAIGIATRMVSKTKRA